MNRWKYVNLWKYMNSPLLIENYSQGPSQGKLIFNIISFPHRSPKRQLILFALKSMEKLPELDFQGGAAPAGHLSCCTSSHPHPPKALEPLRTHHPTPGPGFFCSESLRKLRGAAGGCAQPFGAVFSTPSIPSQKRCFFLPHCCSALAGAILPLPDLIFHSSFKCIDFLLLSSEEEELWHFFNIPKLPQELQ